MPLPSFGDLLLMMFFLLAALFGLGYGIGKVAKVIYLWCLNRRNKLQRYKYPWD